MMKSNKIFSTFLAVLCTFSLTACDNLTEFSFSEPPHRQGEDDAKGEGNIRLVTYNVITFRYSPNIYPNGTYDVIASMMQEVEADAVCLNEIDDKVPRSGNVDQMKRFSEAMGGWDYLFGPAMPYQGGHYGEGVVTKEKTVAKKYVNLPKGSLAGSEPRVLCIMETADFIVMTTHLDHVDEATRVMQMGVINDYVAENYADYTKPIFLGGDLNADHSSLPLQKAKEKWDIISINQPTFSSSNPTKSIDIFLAYKNGAKYTVVKSSVLRSFASAVPINTSDHLPVMVELRLGADETVE